MKKIIIPLMIIIAVVFGIFYFSQDDVKSNLETDVLGSFANWKTYDGKALGLVLKYPADWEVDDSFPDFVSFMPVDANGFNFYRVKAANKKQTLVQWLKNKDKEGAEAMGGQYNDYVISSKKTRVAKLAAIQRVEHADAAGFDIMQTYVKNRNYFYTFAIQMGPYGSYSAVDEKVYNKILSTVQFIK